MNSIKPRKVQSKVIADDYVNKETGELLSSEVKDTISITLKEKTNQFIINSDEYIVFDADAISFLTKELSNSDRGKIMTIANMVKGDCSIICQNNNHPHTTDTLSVTLDMNLNRFYVFVRKMVTAGILAYCVCAPSGYVQKIYMLNPYVARKRKTINCELNTFFRDVTKDGIIKE
jgi:hypothetical protein